MTISLWRNRDFLLLWTGQNVSLMGSEITLLALPIVAGVVLGASPWEMGVVAAARKLPVLVASLPAGVLTDRWRLRPIMILTHLVAGVAMLSIPVAARFDALTLEQLYAVAAVAGLCETLFNPAYQSYPLALLGPDRLVDGNAKLSLAMTVASTLGASVGGFVVGAFGAAKAVLADALSFFVAALAIWAIRTPEPPPVPAPGVPMRTQVAEGLRFVLGHPLIRPIAVALPVISFALGGTHALWIVYVVTDLGWQAHVTGLALGVSGLGGVLGGLVARRVVGRLGLARALLWSSTVYGVGDLPLVLVSRGLAGQIVVTAAWTVVFAGVVVLQVSQRSLRQLLTPPGFHGRLAATIRWLTWGSAPVGALAAGALAEVVGIRATLAVAAVVAAAGPVLLWSSPLRRFTGDQVTS